MNKEEIKIQNEMIIILDKNKRPLGFVSEKRAKQLLTNKKAVVHSIQPFIIRHKNLDARNCTSLEFKIKIDPGSGETGISVLDLNNNIYFKVTLVHRGQNIVANLKTRYDARHNRRNRETRYRRCKYRKVKGKNAFISNRPEEWLPPSVMSIERNIIHWVFFLCKYVNIVECSVEAVSFDFQKMDNPDIEGIEYQHNTKEGKTIRAYLLEKCGYTCQYCGGTTKDKRLEVEHMISRANGGSSKLKNLTIACCACNKTKDNRNLDVWLNYLKQSNSDSEVNKKRIELIEKVLAGQVLRPKNYAAWVNSYKNRLVADITTLFEFRNIELSDGVTTKMNRIKHGLSKQHYNDAACIGNVPETFNDYTTVAHIITATGRGTRLKGSVNSCGILKHDNVHREKTYHGFQTGDICKIDIQKGKYKGTYVARIAIRHSGYFDFKINGKRTATSYKNCTILQHGNGYTYQSVQSL